jgi:DNA-binding winged helix-turn-helix (wHTH) protein/Flp pilus assembly protein TadD
VTNSAAPGDSRVLSFGDFEVDVAALELRHAGRPTRTPPQAVRVLIMLAGRSGELVTREELYAAIWPDPDVDVDRGLNTLIRQLRRALDDNANEPRFIRTYPRRGYRFLAAVVSVTGPAASSVTGILPSGTADRAADAPTSIRSPRPGRKAAAIAILVPAATLAFVVVRSIRRRPAGADGGGVATTADTSLVGQDAALEGEPPPEARQAFLAGKYLLRQADLERRAAAVDWLEQAARSAPDYAPAHAWLADALYWAGRLEDARTEAAQALTLDRDQPRALLVRGTIRLVRDWQWRQAEQDLRAAVALAPRTPEYHHGLAFALSTAGLHQEALAELHTARDLDPVSSIVTGDLGLLYMYAGRFAEAATWCERALDLEPRATWAAECAFDALAHLGRFDDARRHAATLLQSKNVDETDVLGGLPADSAVAAFRAWRARTAWARFLDGKGDAWMTALSLVEAGRNDDAIVALERAARERSIGFVTITVDPRFRSLWSEPRFARIAAGLTDNDFAPVNPHSGP